MKTAYPLSSTPFLFPFPAIHSRGTVSDVLNQAEILNAEELVKSKSGSPAKSIRVAPSKLNALLNTGCPSTKVVVPVTVPSFPPEELVSNTLFSNFNLAISSVTTSFPSDIV